MLLYVALSRRKVYAPSTLNEFNLISGDSADSDGRADYARVIEGHNPPGPHSAHIRPGVQSYNQRRDSFCTCRKYATVARFGLRSFAQFQCIVFLPNHIDSPRRDAEAFSPPPFRWMTITSNCWENPLEYGKHPLDHVHILHYLSLVGRFRRTLSTDHLGCLLKHLWQLILCISPSTITES